MDGALDREACYRALLARDARFDGVFFVGVRTTGIYCRPVCRARTPGEARCVFFGDAAQAERDGFRACFRCRPERAPGSGYDDATSRLVAAAVARIEAGALNDGGLDALAAALGVTARHLRRSVQAELGVSPIELAVTRRLALARQLLHGTSLPVTDVAFASGFQSVRRFNDAFQRRHGVSPTRLRGRARGASPGETDAVRLELGYRPPYDWRSILSFLGARAVDGVERVADGAFVRTAHVGARRGWVSVRPGRGDALSLAVSPSLLPELMTVVTRVRRLFDLDARPAIIDPHLGRDARLAPLVRQRPGLRVPGAFDPFATAMMAVLGQQVTVRAGVTLASRLVAAYGEEVESPFAGLHRAWPTAERVASLPAEKVAALGMPARRARTLVGLATAFASGAVDFDRPAAPEARLAELTSIAGVGPWTAAYILMRAASWPDAFPARDVAILRALRPLSAREPSGGERDTTLADAWRPWRSYATMHLWTSLTGDPP